MYYLRVGSVVPVYVLPSARSVLMNDDLWLSLQVITKEQYCEMNVKMQIALLEDVDEAEARVPTRCPHHACPWHMFQMNKAPDIPSPTCSRI